MKIIFNQSYAPENSELTFETLYTSKPLLAINLFRSYDKPPHPHKDLGIHEHLDFYLDEKELYRLIGVLRLSLKEMKSSYYATGCDRFYSRDALDGGKRLCEICGKPENDHVDSINPNL